jgi:hypothetical protein
MEPLEERPEYPYQNLRTKNYFWGNGDKVSCSNASQRLLVANLSADLIVSFFLLK